MRLIVSAIIVILIGATGYWWFAARDMTQTQNTQAPAGRSIVADVKLPELQGNAVIGQRAFSAKCSACHGENAGGVDGNGPPLIHKIYEPSHHGDQAIFLAAKNGARAHHWRFGDMPAVKGITDAEIGAIIEFIRAVQRENGIS